MASDSATAAEPINEDIDFDGVTPQNTVYVKWDVKGGRDRTHDARLDTNYALEGSPNIQGIETRSAVNIKVRCWSGSQPSGSPNVDLDGPTSGKHKIDARRLGSYRVELR